MVETISPPPAKQTATELSGLTLNPGDHICAFYREPAERDDILIPFLIGGLKSGGKCTCVVDSCSPDHVLRRLTAEIDAQSYVDHCQLEVLDSDETYFATGGPASPAGSRPAGVTARQRCST